MPFTYGPLAYLLKNRTYLGEMGHKGKWFVGEHAAITDSALFNAVEDLLKTNSVTRRQQRMDNHCLLKGLLFDDRGNAMSPSFTTKRGVRYRFYVSSAMISGRRDQAGSLARVAAPELDNRIVSALRERLARISEDSDQDIVSAYVARVVLNKTAISITFKAAFAADGPIKLAWSRRPSAPRNHIETNNCRSIRDPDVSLVQALARAYQWRKVLLDGVYQSIEELAAIVKWNQKVIRKSMRLAFLAPDITEAIVLGSQPQSMSVSELQAIATMSWDEQRRLFGFPTRA